MVTSMRRMREKAEEATKNILESLREDRPSWPSLRLETDKPKKKSDLFPSLSLPPLRFTDQDEPEEKKAPLSYGVFCR